MSPDSVVKVSAEMWKEEVLESDIPVADILVVTDFHAFPFFQPNVDLYDALGTIPCFLNGFAAKK